MEYSKHMDMSVFVCFNVPIDMETTVNRVSMYYFHLVLTERFIACSYAHAQ